MRANTPRAGVCLVRIERQGPGVLITLRAIDDIEQLSTERVWTMTDVEAAVRVVRQFLSAFARRCRVEADKQTE